MDLLLLSFYGKFGPAVAGLRESRKNGRFPHGKDFLGKIRMLYYESEVIFFTQADPAVFDPPAIYCFTPFFLRWGREILLFLRFSSFGRSGFDDVLGISFFSRNSTACP